MEWISSITSFLEQTFRGNATLRERGIEVMSQGLQALALLVGAYFLAKIFSRSISNTVCKRVDETLGKFLGKLSFYSIIIASSLGILAYYKVQVAGAMAVLTAAGFAIGLAFQGTLSNFAAGVLLLVFRPFKVGDMVTAGGIMGRINEIDLFTTTFDTPDNRRFVVPNSSIASGTIENMTFHAHRRVDVTVGVAYKADMEQTRAALMAAATSLNELMISGEKRGFQVLLGQLGPSSVDWTVRFWTATENFALTRERLTQSIKSQLGQAGIDIPFPQMELHLSSNSAIGLAPSLSTTQAYQGVPREHQDYGNEVAERSSIRESEVESSQSMAAHPVRPRMRGVSGEAA